MHAAVVNLGTVSAFAVIVVVQSFRVRDRVAYLWLHGCVAVVEVRTDVVCGRGTRRIFGADGSDYPIFFCLYRKTLYSFYIIILCVLSAFSN